MKKLKAALSTEQGMNLVNSLFFITIFLRNKIAVCCCYACWLAFLLWARRRTPTRAAKIVFLCLIVLAVVVIGLNLYALLF